MLEPPDLANAQISASLSWEFGISARHVEFLPLGADQNTAVYRIVADDAVPYFLKLRHGHFDEIAVTLPKHLADQGVAHIIAPLATRTGQLWTTLNSFAVILYPFIEGGNGYEVALTDRNWIQLGATLKQIQAMPLPNELRCRLPQETFAARWRDSVKQFLDRIEHQVFGDPVAITLAAFLKTKRAELAELVDQTERLAHALELNRPEFVLCHSDLHAGNILIEHADADRFYIVDWDNPILAPKERDLMYAGGGQFGAARMAQEEEALFYRGYGQTQVDSVALAYYRFERIIEDIAAECEQIFLTNARSPDRERALRYLVSNFDSNGAIEIAQSDQRRRAQT